MRKILIAIVCILILSLTIFIIIEGISFGNVNVNGYIKINEINDELDNNIELINKIKETEYIEQERILEKEVKTLSSIRDEYLAKVEAARAKGAKGSKIQIEIYELDFIWARVGNYASDLDLEIKLDVFPGTEEKALNDFKLYNLHFSVSGEYIDIVRFIYKIEGDNALSAQLSDFNMKPAEVVKKVEAAKNAEQKTNGNTQTAEREITGIVAEFTLKNVPLNYKNIIEDKQTVNTNPSNLNLPGTENTEVKNQ